MFLKNYTSNAPVSQTIYRIEQVLIRCGVSGIMKEYTGTNGEIAAISFQLESPAGKVAIRLPADKSKALEALWLDYVNGDKLNAKGDALEPYYSKKKKRRADFAEQAERTAWKIVQDWTEVQMSMIQMRQAEALQVFLPYIFDGKQTVFERVKAGGMRMLLPEKCE